MPHLIELESDEVKRSRQECRSYQLYKVLLLVLLA